MKEKILEYFQSLSVNKQEEVVNLLLERFSSHQELSLSGIRQNQFNKIGISCPYCSKDQIIAYGNQKGQKRYKCKSCSRTFSTLTGTAIDKIHKKHLLREYLFYMLSGFSLRTIAKEMDVCLKTAFDWRHKILNSLNAEFGNELEGIIEADETFFIDSKKGEKQLNRKPRKRGGKASKRGINKDHVTVITIFERKTGKFLNKVVCRGRITKKAIEKGFGSSPLNPQKSILCSDSHNTFQAYAKDNNITIKPIFVRRKEFVIDKIYHIQNVNRIHSELKYWLKGFKGVATKYLQNYLNYFRLVIELKNSSLKTQEAIGYITYKNDSYLQRENIKQLNCIT